MRGTFNEGTFGELSARQSKRPRCKFEHSQPERAILSEFYHLRRTAIKDIAAYIGFLTGFIGAAPLAWSLLSDQLASGSFVRGLWYFFGIVIAAGIFTGTAGLGIGYVAGVAWEQFHRHRRRERLGRAAAAEPTPGSAPASMPSGVGVPPRLQLLPAEVTSVPEIEGKTLVSVRFAQAAADLDFSGAPVHLTGNTTIASGGQRYRFPDPGSRDALCSLIAIAFRRSGCSDPTAWKSDSIRDRSWHFRWR